MLPTPFFVTSPYFVFVFHVRHIYRPLISDVLVPSSFHTPFLTLSLHRNNLRSEISQYPLCVAMSAFTTYRRSDTPTPPPPESSRALEEVIRTALKDENWTKNAQKAEETFVPITADDLTRHGLRDPYRKLMEAIDLLPSPSIDIRLDLLPPNARTTELASYADTLTEALRDSEEFRRLWTLMLDSPSDFIQVWRIFLNTDDPRRHYVLNLSGNLVQQCCLEESKTAGLRHVWEGLIQGGLCDLFPTVFYRVHSPSSLRSVILIGRGVLDWARRSSSSAKHRVIMPRFLRQLNELWKVIWAHELMLRDDSPFDKVVHARDCAPSCLRESLQLMVFAYLPQIENE
ncbi:hypothetical protein PENSPDRAFT_235218 [Peniophora sp. CONT]|nr:hypothetical protein PENSPDRAFT_235218 [Peniophora sp. CONT]